MGKRAHVIFGLVGAAAIVGVAALPSVHEVLTVQAIATVPLYDPSTVAGKWDSSPKTVGVMRPGEIREVIACNPRKSDIDIEVSFQGQAAVIGGRTGEYKLLRRPAHRWEPGAIASCYRLP